MDIYLEILEAEYIFAEKEIDNLDIKDLVPKMVFRRKLTQAAKIVIYLADKIKYNNERVVYGSSFGELLATTNILDSLYKKEGISPTSFQNSVYNTAVSYLSILTNNKKEIMTISSGDNTSNALMKAAAIKALDKDEIVIFATETLNIEGIEQVNKCIKYLECGVALKVRVSEKKSQIEFNDLETKKELPKSLASLVALAEVVKSTKQTIVKLTL